MMTNMMMLMLLMVITNRRRRIACPKVMLIADDNEQLRKHDAILGCAKRMLTHMWARQFEAFQGHHAESGRTKGPCKEEGAF